MGRTASAHAFRVTPRDREIVRWVGRLRMASARQVADRFRLGRAVSYARLSGLVRLGLIQHARIFHVAPGVYLATRSGLAAVGFRLPPARVDLRTYDHDLELTSLVVELEREFGANRVRTEREMRAVDTPPNLAPTARPQFAVPMSGARGQMQLTPVGNPRLHFPDCAVLVGPDRVMAVELERTAKGRARLRRILSAYVSARHIAGVRYYAHGDRVRNLVDNEVAELKASAVGRIYWVRLLARIRGAIRRAGLFVGCVLPLPAPSGPGWGLGVGKQGRGRGGGVRGCSGRHRSEACGRAVGR